jgi:hypothetical protein
LSLRIAHFIGEKALKAGMISVVNPDGIDSDLEISLRMEMI